jgi:selenocysteine-specific elongation factor
VKRLLLHADMIGDLEGKVLGILDRLHEANPLMSTHDRKSVQSHLDYVGDDTLVQAAVEGMIQRKVLVGDLRRVGRADFKPKLSTNLRKLKDKMIAAYQGAGFQPPEPAAFIPQAGGNASNLKDLFDVCCAEGHLVKVTEEIYLHGDVDAKMRHMVTERLNGGRGLTVAEIRDMLGTTRKYAVPLCEYLDRSGLTRREGDLRFLAGAAAHA